VIVYTGVLSEEFNLYNSQFNQPTKLLFKSVFDNCSDDIQNISALDLNALLTLGHKVIHIHSFSQSMFFASIKLPLQVK
jgi:hypothetical protein